MTAINTINFQNIIIQLINYGPTIRLSVLCMATSDDSMKNVCTAVALPNSEHAKTFSCSQIITSSEHVNSFSFISNSNSILPVIIVMTSSSSPWHHQDIIISMTSSSSPWQHHHPVTSSSPWHHHHPMTSSSPSWHHQGSCSHLITEIHSCSPAGCLYVQGCVGSDKVTHVSYVDPHLKSMGHLGHTCSSLLHF